MIHSTSAGTQGIVNASRARATQIVTGSLVNAGAVCDYIRAQDPEVVSLIAMGKAGMERVPEDLLAARYMRALLQRDASFDLEGEIAYLKSLPKKVCEERLKALVDLKAFCFIYTSGHLPSRQEIDFWKKSGAVVMVSQLATRVIANRGAFVLEKLAAPSTTIYGTMVEVGGLGVLFEGDPGLGKSETALGLIKRGCALVADDLTCIRKAIGNNLLYGSASESTAGYMEIRGIGIMHIPSIFGVNAVRGEKRLQLVVTFKHLKDVKGEIDRTGQTRHVKRILGVDVPNVIIPVSEGRDLVNLVETAAQQQRLILSGHDPVEELAEHLRRRADARRLEGNAKPKGRIVNG
jgi:HPr kinase/phosphorylase